ncbi:MAG: CheR family methyltransferase [Steroidobacteraceae bacterium]
MTTGESGTLHKAARALYRFAKWDLLMGGVLLPYGRARHRMLLQHSDRSNTHTYTSFYRSPPQLDALAGPVLDHFEKLGRKELSILLFAASSGAEPYTFASELLHRRPGLPFSIRASDLHDTMVIKGAAGFYTHDEVMRPWPLPQEFIARTFDPVGERYRVKSPIRDRVRFEQADLLDPHLPGRFESADIVVMQNVLFHLPPDLARAVFANVIQTLKAGGVLFIEGMELDMRVELTRKAGLLPLDYRVKEIHQYARLHFPERWWNYYYASEPYSLFASDRLARYSTIFLAPT